MAFSELKKGTHHGTRNYPVEGQMTPQAARRFRTVLIVWVIILAGLRAVHSSDLATGSIDGKVDLVLGEHTVPVSGARLELMSISDEGGKYQAETDDNGRYTVDLPRGTYKMLLSWAGGDCAEIHRAPFRLDAASHLTLDFLVMQCPSSEPIWKYLPPEEAKKEAEKYRKSHETNPMNVPLNEQTENYQEQVIPAENNRWPDIVLSFGKYDNRAEEIRYFPLHQLLLNPFHIPNPPTPLSLPVTITVDRYTLRASSVILEKRRMVFKANGQVLISDGTHETNARSATLFFSDGEPKIKVNR